MHSILRASANKLLHRFQSLSGGKFRTTRPQPNDPMSRVYNVSEDWRGFQSVKNLVIFGDSYSAIGYDSRSPHPSPENPLGVEFPGAQVWTEKDLPNWVGHLVTYYRGPEAPLLVYDYAVGGHTIAGVNNQVNHHFLANAGKQPAWAPWRSSDTLFITWIGINDCAYMNREEQCKESLQKLFEMQEELYRAGARSFLFIDVPPIDRAPAFLHRSPDKAKLIFQKWNDELSSQCEAFVRRHSDVSAFIFSSWQSFSCLLDDPDIYGFPVTSAQLPGGSMWIDHIHPTSAVHKVICDNFYEFISSIPAYGDR